MKIGKASRKHIRIAKEEALFPAREGRKFLDEPSLFQYFFYKVLAMLQPSGGDRAIVDSPSNHPL